jgi:HAE1 family hydrophobic/amphiphilic exporter-1
VVDDAIVVVEGVARHIERGLTPKDASIAAMRELFGPIVGITLVLMSVFLPAAFLPGISGQMYRQFALVMAATALISAINAATLKPTQCALWLRPAREHRGWFSRGFERVYGLAERGFVGLVRRMVGLSLLMTAVGLGLGGVAVWGYAKLPTAFIPFEDQGYMVVGLLMPEGASLERTDATLAKVGQILQGTPGVDQVVSIAGISVLDNSASLANGGAIYVILDTWSQRGKNEDLLSLFQTMTSELGAIEEGDVYVLLPPPIQGIGNAAGFQMEIELRDKSFDYQKLQNVTQDIARKAASQSGIRAVNSPFQAGAAQLRVTVDRVKAETLGVQVGDVFDALASFLGSSYINQFNLFGRTFQVYVQAADRFRLKPEEINRLYVRNDNGDMVPLGTMVDISYQAGPSLINLYDLNPAAQILGLQGLDFSTGQAMALLEQIADDVLPPGMAYEWTGISYQENLLGAQAYYVFALALALVYLALAAQYESWLIPISVLLAVPIAVLGTVGALNLVGVASNLYMQIGVVLLIALAAKNAILVVEYARNLRVVEGREIIDAAVEAARLRFRPILMTSFAFILGVLPLVWATGAAAASRQALGTAVFGGMVTSTVLAVFFVPVFYVAVQSMIEYWAPLPPTTELPDASKRWSPDVAGGPALQSVMDVGPIEPFTPPEEPNTPRPANEEGN